MKAPTIDDLNTLLFNTLTGLDNDADIEKAKVKSSIAKVMIDAYKVKVQALAILSKADNPSAVKQTIENSGITSKVHNVIE